MAGLAIHIEPRFGMIGILSQGKIAEVATVAVNRGSAKFVILIIHVAGLAVGNGMNAHQGESAGGVHFQHLLLVTPVIGGMAALAGGSKLPAVNIGMAIGAGGSHLRKFQTAVAVHTVGELVSADEQKTGFIMFEIHGIFHLLPGSGFMAALAIPLNGTVGILAAGLPQGISGACYKNQR
jgi:hypothetical protein